MRIDRVRDNPCFIGGHLLTFARLTLRWTKFCQVRNCWCPVREIEILLPAGVDCEAIERIVDEAVALVGLQITLRGSLKKYPGCLHWHVQRPGVPGTLEITLWPEQHRAWFTVQDGRRAPWIDGAVRRVRTAVQRRLRDT